MKSKLCISLVGKNHGGGQGNQMGMFIGKVLINISNSASQHAIDFVAKWWAIFDANHVYKKLGNLVLERDWGKVSDFNPV
jgi:hypothetical protein